MRSSPDLLAAVNTLTKNTTWILYIRGVLECLNKLFFLKKYIKIIFFIFKILFLILIYQNNSKNKKIISDF